MKKQKFRESLAGATFEGRQETLKRLLGEEVGVLIYHEEDNEYDPNAHKVEVVDGPELGYLKARTSKFLIQNKLKIFNNTGMAYPKCFEDESGKVVYYADLDFEAVPETYHGD